MFGLYDDVLDFLDDPIGETTRIVTQPLRDSVEVLEGLSEGEIRAKAALRLGADVVSGMAIGEVVEFLEL